MTVKQLIELLQTMPDGSSVDCKDIYNDRYYHPRNAILTGYDDDGEECHPTKPGCSKVVVLQITEV